MNRTLMVLLLGSITLIAGCSSIPGVSTTVETTVPTTSVDTTIDSTTTIDASMETETTTEFDLDCPEKYQRNNANGTSYCPNPKIFGADTWEELESQELIDDI